METAIYGKLSVKNQRHKPGVAKQTGFPSPATHYLEPTIDLNQELVKHADATFFVRVEGSAFADVHIYDQDVLIIDRSLVPKVGELALIVNAGDFKIVSMPGNEASDAIILWGKITYIIHKTK